jgi:hypothetical protein
LLTFDHFLFHLEPERERPVYPLVAVVPSSATFKVANRLGGFLLVWRVNKRSDDKKENHKMKVDEEDEGIRVTG